MNLTPYLLSYLLLPNIDHDKDSGNGSDKIDDDDDGGD